MIRRTFLIIFVLSAYIYLVSSDPEGTLMYKANKFYKYCTKRYKNMNLQYHVNKWPDSKSKKRHY